MRGDHPAIRLTPRASGRERAADSRWERLTHRGPVPVAIETFEDRLRTAVVEAQSQLLGPAQYCAWTRV
jgi:hypothetical protein